MNLFRWLCQGILVVAAISLSFLVLAYVWHMKEDIERIERTVHFVLFMIHILVPFYLLGYKLLKRINT